MSLVCHWVIFNEFKHSFLLTNKANPDLKIDLRNNLFTSLDTLQTTIVDNCQKPSTTHLLLSGNPLICNCKNTWWSKINSTLPIFATTVSKNTCLQIKDFEILTCQSIVSLQHQQPQQHHKMRNGIRRWNPEMGN